MLRKLRALLRTESPLPAYVHYHLDDEGREILCDESRCRPSVRSLPYLVRH
ncbi:MAG TPA: hypothetical protein VN635_07700 [Conexibacter sp.]|nr:hypothetical protein [Conexibacter sp.]